jgi:hypothetical protein
VQAIEAGLLTDGSSYSPTPSQRLLCQWRILLAFVPAHSGASVRDLHPLPVSSTSLAITCNHSHQYPAWQYSEWAIDVTRDAQAVKHFFGKGSARAMPPHRAKPSRV